MASSIHLLHLHWFWGSTESWRFIGSSSVWAFTLKSQWAVHYWWMDLMDKKDKKILKPQKTWGYHRRQHHLLVASGQWCGVGGLGGYPYRTEITEQDQLWNETRHTHDNLIQMLLNTHSHCKRAVSEWVNTLVIEPKGCRCCGLWWKSCRVKKKECIPLHSIECERWHQDGDGPTEMLGG